MEIQTMNKIENAASIFEALTQYEQYSIKTVKIGDIVWFRAKDIAEILDYSNTKQAIGIHVSEKHKSSFSKIFGGLENRPPKIGANDLKTIYIKEAGIYSLIYQSKKRDAERFKDWICEDLLPKLRKEGTYTMNQEYIQKLKLEKDKLALEYEEKLQERELQMFEEKKANEEREQKLTQELEKARKRELKLTEFINNTKELEFTEILYIGTSAAYQQQNHFKIGGVASLAALPGRFSTYNSGRPTDDKFFCVKYWEVHSYAALEKVIKTCLVHFKDKNLKNSEDYHIHGKALVSALEFIIENESETIQWFNERIGMFAKMTIDEEPVIFAPIILKKKLEITAGENKIELCDITNWPEEKITQEINIMIDLFKEKMKLEELGAEIVWKDFSPIVKERYRDARLLTWRPVMKRELSRRGKKLRIR